MKNDETSQFTRALTRRRMSLLASLRNQRDARFDAEGSLAGSQISAYSDELFQISNALDRIRHGLYGVCRVCGSKVPDARLRENPYSSTCAGCPSEG